MKNVTFETAVALFRQGQFDKAKAQCDTLLESHPNDSQALCLLADTLEALGQGMEAENKLKRASALDPECTETLCKLGLLYLRRQKYMQASLTFLAATQIKEDFVPAYLNLGISLWAQGNETEAVAAFRQTIALQHDFTPAHVALANALLARGEYEEGWRESEWSQHRPKLPSMHERPRWDGTLTPGSSLLIKADEDSCNTLLACRYLPFIAEKKVHVVLQCERKLVSLLTTLPSLVTVIDNDTPPPYHEAQLPLLSLPRLFTTRVSTIPGNIPYLRASEAGISKWRKKLSEHEDKIRIGLCWSDTRKSSDSDARSMPTALLERLGELHHVVFISLQSDAPDDVAKLQEKIPLLDFTPEFEDFSDMAALMTNLNLIISVDAPALHLAGALGMNAWGLLHHATDWQWIADGYRSLWYPQTLLFKQNVPGEWEDVMAAVKYQLLAAIPSDE